MEEIRLRAPEIGDIDMLFRLENESDVAKVTFTYAPVSRQMIWEYIDKYTANPVSDRQLRWIIEADGKPVGTIDIYDYNPIDMRAFIGVAIEPGMRGKGIAKASLRMAIAHCRDVLGLHQLAAIVPKDNEPSKRLFACAGFRASGCLRSWLRRSGKYTDAVILQLLFK